MESILHFKYDQITVLPEKGTISCSVPSNIALVKYWGKKEMQIPANPSLSFTLDMCKTTTTLHFSLKEIESDHFDFELLFEGQSKPTFKPKIQSFLERIDTYLPFLKKYSFVIETKNSFPHSSGIASSASGMGALAYCFMELERKIHSGMTQNEFMQKTSFLARLGSGSACRSLEGPITIWGVHEDFDNSSDTYAIKFTDIIHPVFDQYQDTILLIDKGEKQISSTVGHGLMKGHPFAQQRFEQAHRNISTLKNVLKSGDLNSFVQIVESEALTLHSMMMTSLPYFILMKPNTLSVINKVWEYRAATGSYLCFTLDAGANVHLLYPQEEKEKVKQFISSELVAFCQDGQYICDTLGKGAELL